jgi:hypothetical protein
MRAGFDQMFDGTATLNLVTCLGGPIMIEALSPPELRRHIFIIVFSLRHCAGSLYKAGNALKF